METAFPPSLPPSLPPSPSPSPSPSLSLPPSLPPLLSFNELMNSSYILAGEEKSRDNQLPAITLPDPGQPKQVVS